MSAAPADPFNGVTPTELAIAKLELRPGDVLAVHVDAILDMATVGRIREHLALMLPQGVKAMVIDRGTSLSVIRDIAK